MLLLGRFKIYGRSMEPTLKEGQQVLASFLPYLIFTPKIGDLIVIYDPRDEKILVKRISKFENKLPRSKLRGIPQAEKFDSRLHLRNKLRSITTRNNQLFVTGDNTSQSTDSRHFGPITKNNILAKIIFVF